MYERLYVLRRGKIRNINRIKRRSYVLQRGIVVRIYRLWNKIHWKLNLVQTFTSLVTSSINWKQSFRVVLGIINNLCIVNILCAYFY